MIVYTTSVVALVLIGSLTLLLWRIPRLADGKENTRVLVEFFRFRIEIEVGKPGDRQRAPTLDE